MKFFNPPQDDQPYANEVAKCPDLERNTMKGYQPQDLPAYVSVFTLLAHS